jgi:hypothetical protein
MDCVQGRPRRLPAYQGSNGWTAGDVEFAQEKMLEKEWRQDRLFSFVKYHLKGLILFFSIRLCGAT